MRRYAEKGERFNKITGFAIVANAVQILCALGILFYTLFSKSFNIPEQAEIILVAAAAAVVIWGAAVDIRDAFITRRIERQRLMLQDAYGQLEELNLTLRRQRHDFKNHLQVVYTLTEMGAYADVQDYVQKIYEDVQSVSRLMKTSIPAVNALLSAKSADCGEKGISFEAEIQSNWQDMPVAGWELCRILGNLVDNAMDALLDSDTPQPCIRVRIGETLLAWTLCVENNGPEIPDEHKTSVFLAGFTTKSAGHGNGLSIVSELVEAYEGSLELESDPSLTRFLCRFPRPEARNRENSVP